MKSNYFCGVNNFMFGIYKLIMDRLERRSTILMIRCLIQGKSAANWKKKKKEWMKAMNLQTYPSKIFHHFKW